MKFDLFFCPIIRTLRRYQSLNRSFRRNERPTPSRRGRRDRVSPPSNLEENMSLTLTRAEADAMLRGENTPSGAYSSRKKSKKRNSTGSSKRWPFSRKSSKSITQQNTPNSGDNILVVSPSPIGGGDLEFTTPESPSSTRSSVSPGRSTSGSVDSESSVTRSSGGNAEESVFVESVAGDQVISGTHGGDVVTEQQQGSSDTAREFIHT